MCGILTFMNAIESYIFGLLLADGNLYRSPNGNKGRVSLEISRRDEDIVDALVEHIKGSSKRHRKRDTNFKNDVTTVTFTQSQKWFRDWLIECGYPIDHKAANMSCPNTVYIERDFWRGIIDADGSLGFTGQKFPFISLTITSDSLYDAYISYLAHVCGIRKRVNRNTRDNIYNVMVTRHDAKVLATVLYSDAQLAINRKQSLANEIACWDDKQLAPQRRRTAWLASEDAYIISHSLENSMRTLQRTESSIKTRLWRLKKSHHL